MSTITQPLVDIFESRNVRSSLEQLFPDQTFQFVNNENLFKIELNDLVLYSLNGKLFIFANTGIVQSQGADLWEILGHYCKAIFYRKMQQVFDNTSILESFKGA